ncbi:TlyA family RNA methyltransferase [Uliginosibacterium sp. H1]|uniref:TlyA family RNA methyltransferase n=1 Tax=Uliginosibacterium sp. H1 TaxID=3114757 RepID=UPI002E17F7BF|nr:TlyA family RNA methyltransferase [Uliginosibacterium sp. H1]
MDSFHARTPRSKPATPAAGAAAREGLPRIDQLLVERGLAASRTAAQRLIAAGRVSWRSAQGSTLVRKPSELLPDSAELHVTPDEADRFVSRGGLKLDGALARSGLDVVGMTCLDVGQSTGGFSDCLLQAGAARVIGVEVGHGQLHARLHEDARCVTLEGINARELSADQLGAHMPPGGFGLVVCDASFISLGLLLPRWPALLQEGGHVLSLVKPQFEVGPQGVGRGGIVRDASLYPQVEARIRDTCGTHGLQVLDYFDSPITGSDGNREFFVFAQRGNTAALHEATSRITS